MIEKITLTRLRQNLFQIADQILASGEPVSVERHGRTLTLTADQRPSRLARLSRRSLIVGDIESLATEQVSEWHERTNLS